MALNTSCSEGQLLIQMKYQALFSLKIKNKYLECSPLQFEKKGIKD